MSKVFKQDVSKFVFLIKAAEDQSFVLMDAVPRDTKMILDKYMKSSKQLCENLIGTVEKGSDVEDTIESGSEFLIEAMRLLMKCIDQLKSGDAIDLLEELTKGEVEV